MGTDAFVKVIGEAAADDTRRHLIKEGVQAGQTLVGWLKVAVTDVGGQIATGSYFRPLYILGTEISPSVPATVNDADTLKRETWFKGLFDISVDTGVDDADTQRLLMDTGAVIAGADDAED